MRHRSSLFLPIFLALVLQACSSMQVRPYLHRELAPEAIHDKITQTLDNHGKTLVFDETGGRAVQRSEGYVVAGMLSSGTEVTVPYDSLVEIRLEQSKPNSAETAWLTLGVILVGAIVSFLYALSQI